MPNFDVIRASNPTAVPEDTDLIVIQKANGGAASYTLQELAAYVAGVSLPVWLTDASNGCLLSIVFGGDTTMSHTSAGILPFNNIIRDTGFYASQGTITVPAGVSKLQIIAQVKTTLANPTVRVIKDGSIAVPIVQVTGAGGYALVVSPEIDVSIGDDFQIHCDAAGSISLGSETFFNVRTTEKLV
jgi:hypothetical protein